VTPARTGVTLGGAAAILLAALLLAPPASAYDEGAVPTIENPTHDACLINAGPTPLGDSGAECAHASVEATIVTCTGSSASWGCSFRVTVRLTLDAGVCGNVTVDAASTSGCWNPTGADLVPTPPPGEADGSWYAATYNGVKWIATVPGRVIAQDVGADLSQPSDWAVQIEVPPPPVAPSGAGCPANGSYATAAAGPSSTGAGIFAPQMGLAVQKYVSPLAPHAAASAKPAASTEVMVKTSAMSC